MLDYLGVADGLKAKILCCLDVLQYANVGMCNIGLEIRRTLLTNTNNLL